MAKKKYSEPGLNYVIELGMKTAKTQGALENQLFESTSKSLVYKLLTQMTALAEGHQDYIEFYKVKEADFNMSIALDGAIYADFFRKICNWIAAHKSLFHGNILEIGCGCGIVACFIAKLCPEATITAMDRCSGAIKNAQLLAQKLNVTNIDFICCDLISYPVDLQFDVVYSSRTLAENSGLGPENIVMDFEELAYLFENNLKNYAQRIACHVKDGGTYISVVKSNLNSLMYGWLTAIEEANLNLDYNYYEQIVSQEICDDCNYQVFTATKEKKYSYNAHDFFGGAFQTYYRTDLPLYYGNEAKAVYFYKRGKLIEGYEFFDKLGNLVSKIAGWTHAYDETGMLFFQNVKGHCMLQFHDIGEKEEMLEAIRKEVTKCKKDGFTVKEMSADNSTLQELIKQQSIKKQSEPILPTHKALRKIVFPNH